MITKLFWEECMENFKKHRQSPEPQSELSEHLMEFPVLLCLHLSWQCQGYQGLEEMFWKVHSTRWFFLLWKKTLEEMETLLFPAGKRDKPNFLETQLKIRAKTGLMCATVRSRLWRPTGPSTRMARCALLSTTKSSNKPSTKKYAQYPQQQDVLVTVLVNRSTSGTGCWPTILTTTAPVSSWTGSSSHPVVCADVPRIHFYQHKYISPLGKEIMLFSAVEYSSDLPLVIHYITKSLAFQAYPWVRITEIFSKQFWPFGKF